MAAVRARSSELCAVLPARHEGVYPYDTTPFVRVSIEGSREDAVRGHRAGVPGDVSVPAELARHADPHDRRAGRVARHVRRAGGLRLFDQHADHVRLVLAIGLLVDDAIVVVENVERVMAEEGLSPEEATRKSMDQITGALVGIALVLSAVFVPMAFFGGSIGVIYRQFSLTIVSAMRALGARRADPHAGAVRDAAEADSERPPRRKSAASSAGSTAFSIAAADRYASGVGTLLRRSGRRSCCLRAHRRGGRGCCSCARPTGFLPDEDPGVLFARRNFRPARPVSRRDKVLKKMENHFLENEKDLMEGMFGVHGFSFSGTGQNQVLVFVKLKDWDERRRPEQKVKAIQDRAMAKFMQFKDAFAFAFAPPAVLELGNATGFDVRLVDRAGLGHDVLMGARNQFLGMAMQNPVVTKVRPNGLDDTPQSIRSISTRRRRVRWAFRSAISTPR